MSKIYDTLVSNQVLSKEKLQLVKEYDRYLIENYGVYYAETFGIDSEDERENNYQVQLIEHAVVRNLSDKAFVKALNIITVQWENRTKIFEILLNKKELEGKWSDTCVDYLAEILVLHNLFEEDLEDFLEQSNNINKFIEINPTLSVLTSKRFQSLTPSLFDENLKFLLESKYYYINANATVLSSFDLPKQKREEALKVIDGYYDRKTEDEVEYETLKEIKNKTSYEKQRMQVLQNDIEQRQSEGEDDFISNKEFVAKIAISKAMVSRLINIKEYTSMLLLIDRGLGYLSEDKNQFFQNLMLSCLNAESYGKDKKKLFRSINYILENIYEKNNEYALLYAASDKAFFYSDEEFDKITETLIVEPFETEEYVKNVYELVINENVGNEPSKEEYFKVIQNKDLNEIKKMTAFQNYLAYDRLSVQNTKATIK